MPRFSLAKRRHPIVLLTDFGFRDYYVGVMKGVIYGVAPEARIVDLSHNIMPQDVAEAAFVLASSYRYFPPGTIFVCVVDPGVGSDRAIICAEIDKRVFLAPDNGLLGILASEHAPKNVYEVTNTDYFLQDLSRTFHGRDIFAPVAGHLSSGVSPSAFGPAVAHLRNLPLPKPVRTPSGSLRGEIVYIDQFGNLVTSISEATLRNSFRCPDDHLAVSVKRRTIQGMSQSYSAREAGELLATISSSGFLEVAVNQGSAERELGCQKGDSVTLSVARSKS